MGEYSTVPILSPIGKEKDVRPVKVFLSCPLWAMIIREEEKVPAMVAAAPNSRLLEPRSNEPFDSVNVPLTFTAPPSSASPLAWLIVRLLYVPPPTVWDVP